MTNVAKRRQGDGQAVTKVQRLSPVTFEERMPTESHFREGNTMRGSWRPRGGSAGVRAHGMSGKGWMQELGKPTGVSPRGE